MRDRSRFVGESEPSVPDDALGQLEGHDLRVLIRELLLEVDGGVRGRVLDRVVGLAVGKGSGWAPEGPDEDAVAEVLAFAEAAEREIGLFFNDGEVQNPSRAIEGWVYDMSGDKPE